MNAFLESDQPMREIENENDVLRDLILKAGVEANAHVAAAKLQKVLIGELHPREEHAAYLILLVQKVGQVRVQWLQLITPAQAALPNNKGEWQSTDFRSLDFDVALERLHRLESTASPC